MTFSISFYLVAILFLIFDLEIAIIFPVASILYEVDVFGFFIAILFLIILTIGFVYEFSSGAIKTKTN
jgi:NADH-ubiquinone oxidoreductase chain 3